MLHLLVLIALFAFFIRIVTAPFRWGRYHRHCGWYGNRYGWYGNRWGYRRPYGGGLLTILALVALEKLFDRRY